MPHGNSPRSRLLQTQGKLLFTPQSARSVESPTDTSGSENLASAGESESPPGFSQKRRLAKARAPRSPAKTSPATSDAKSTKVQKNKTCSLGKGRKSGSFFTRDTSCSAIRGSCDTLTEKRRSRNPVRFSHEVTTSGAGMHPLSSFHDDSEAFATVLKKRFHDAKREVDLELAAFAGDLVELMEEEEGRQPSWCKAHQEDLLLLARECAFMSADEFRDQCESIVQRLDEERQCLAMGRSKQLHTRMLFILTRCTRLLQFQKESTILKGGLLSRECKSGTVRNSIDSVILKEAPNKRHYSQELGLLKLKLEDITYKERHARKERELGLKDRVLKLLNIQPPRTPKQGCEAKSSERANLDRIKVLGEEIGSKDEGRHSCQRKEVHYDDFQLVLCRICEEEVPTWQLEEHSRICALAVWCDAKGSSVDDRLYKIAEVLEKILDSHACSATQSPGAETQDVYGSCAFNVAMTQSIGLCSKESFMRHGEDDSQDVDASSEVMSFKTLFRTKSGQSVASSSVGSLTPRSPFSTVNHFDIQLLDQRSLGEYNDPAQISELADIARCVAGVNSSDYGLLEYLVSCLQDLQDIMRLSRAEGVIVHVFGKQIEKFLREKYFQFSESSKTVENTRADINDGKADTHMDDTHLVGNLASIKERTSIEDFEILKPISSGAFGRVYLAKKKTTGDLFAIKALRKVDMIRKNAVQSILAERDILISICNPFVVRFFYSFTSKENLYLVMEYLVGGDLYSLLKNVGCLDEDVARIYAAEIVLALEYLHSLGVVHRDLKPDNLLIAYDGHLKLTDFGLSKMGLLKSTDNLSGTPSYGLSCFHNDHDFGNLSHRKEEEEKHSAIGTPDYLAPEILLGMAHGSSADWWSLGIIIFEFLTGVPPFNADDPQKIFDNILNRKIPWPSVPDDMSYAAKDLIDKLLIEDPNERLGANGAAEVKVHPFFKDINWDTLAQQKATFVPNPESPQDTSYFTCRHPENASEDVATSVKTLVSCELAEDCSREVVDHASMSSRSSFSDFSFKNLSQLASINYDLLMQYLQKDSR